jgi:pyruvate/2-oxoglutarate dehydrogenase complex dihydrolipoamide acyltransferase (E2) component
VGLGISVLLALVVISLALWLLRRSATDESTPATPEPEEGVEAGLEEEEAAVVGEASTPGEGGEQKDEAQATPAAARKAEDLGVDLSQIAGTGSGGRITVKDVREAANQA